MTPRTKTSTKTSSKILAAMHETARDLHAAGFIDLRKMKTYEALCLAPIPAYSHTKIRALRARHKLTGNDPDDFMVRTQEEMASVRTETTKTMTTLLAAIAGVSLLVGGIGIMNIMLVSVTERTREIGLRMAIGARGKDVLLQFLVEAVVLSLFGGLLGIGMGYGLSAAAERFLQWPTSIPANAIGMAFGFAAGTGVFFGFYPAKKAAGLDPIEALRFE